MTSTYVCDSGSSESRTGDGIVSEGASITVLYNKLVRIAGEEEGGSMSEVGHNDDDGGSYSSCPSSDRIGDVSVIWV